MNFCRVQRLLPIIIQYLPDNELVVMADVNKHCRKLSLKERVVRVFGAFPRELGQFAARYYLPADAFAVELVAARCLPFKRDLIQRINLENINFADIDRSKEQVMRPLVTEVLILNIEGSPNPVEIRGNALITAAMDGDLGIAIALLANGPIDEDRRFVAVETAARNNHLDIVQQLLVGHEDLRSTAVVAAAGQGHLETVRALLAHVTYHGG
jgi:hypothetical protein